MYLPKIEGSEKNHEADGLPENVPDSVKATWKALSTGEPMTGGQLREATGLPRRTIYTAIRRLRELNLLCEQASLRDTRQTYFWLKPPLH